MKEPQFLYLSSCCRVAATKPACVKPVSVPKKKGKKGGHEKKATEFATLGKWRCGQCGKGCSVTRTNRPNEPKN